MRSLGLTIALIIFVCTQSRSSITQGTPENINIVTDNSSQPLDGKTQGSEQQIDEEYLQKVEDEAVQEETKGKLNEWIAGELQEAGRMEGFKFGEQFVVHLLPQQSFEYKWTMNNPQSRKRDYMLFLSIFTYQNGDDVAAIQNPDQDSYVQIQTKSKFQESYSLMGKLYLAKVFSITFTMDSKFIRLTNRNSIPVLVELNMEVDLKELTVEAGIATNKHFALPAEKLATIYEELKNTQKSRTQMYKWEWGFLEKEERYDEEMLKLTGVELLAILATAIVQMYCIKGLLQNRQII